MAKSKDIVQTIVERNWSCTGHMVRTNGQMVQRNVESVAHYGEKKEEEMGWGKYVVESVGKEWE